MKTVRLLGVEYGGAFVTPLASSGTKVCSCTGVEGSLSSHLSPVW